MNDSNHNKPVKFLLVRFSGKKIKPRVMNGKQFATIINEYRLVHESC